MRLFRKRDCSLNLSEFETRSIGFVIKLGIKNKPELNEFFNVFNEQPLIDNNFASATY